MSTRTRRTSSFALAATLTRGTSGTVTLVGISAAAMAAAAAVPTEDLAARAMIGDTGAHAPGAPLGAAVAADNGRAGLLAHAAALVVSAVYGERVSGPARSL
ncbi:hypothetical protein [Streptomyces sp. NPDC058964]|uniref:hypothetical protein n=1 Tax=Streptomyces sp. NPDC058964 TaxID=3346681 RepID=UPI00369366DA